VPQGLVVRFGLGLDALCKIKSNQASHVQLLQKYSRNCRKWWHNKPHKTNLRHGQFSETAPSGIQGLNGLPASHDWNKKSLHGPHIE